MKSGIEGWQTIRKLMQGYRSVQVLLTCNHLGIFRHLAGGPRRAEKIAGLTASHPEATRRLLNAAVAEGLLIKTGGVYANSRLAATCLAEEGPLFLGNMARLEQAQYERWGRLPEAIHTGRWPEPNRQMEEHTRWVRNFVFALYDMARASAPAIAEALGVGHRPAPSSHRCGRGARRVQYGLGPPLSQPDGNGVRVARCCRGGP